MEQVPAAAAVVAERARILDELRRAWDGDPWHGDSLRTILHGLTAESAAAHPLPDAHTAWEIVLHLTAWTREVTRRLRDRVARDPADGDWPAARGDWDGALDALARAHAELVAAIAEFPPAELEQVVGEARNRALGAGVTYAVMLHGVSQHYAYHGGQVALLRKSVG